MDSSLTNTNFPTPANEVNSNHKHFAICYHGMTRSTRYVYQSHIDNIFNIITEKNATYDVYLHTWRSNNNMVWGTNFQIPNDYTEHLFLHPKDYQLDDQDEYLNSIDFHDYYYPNTPEWRPELIRNYLCALESQKRCFIMCKNSNIKYDYVIFVRPDALIQTKLPYDDIYSSFSSFSSSSSLNTPIFIPNDSWYEGYNDRFAITRFDTAEHYAYRINEMKYYRQNINYIIAERFCKWIIDKYYSINPIEFKFELIRPNNSFA